MYAFTISCFLEGVPPAALHVKMMGQPPWDTQLTDGYFLLHYTYGMDYTKICCCLYAPYLAVPLTQYSLRLRVSQLSCHTVCRNSFQIVS